MTQEEKQDVLQRINQEGFDYTFIKYSRFEDIKDKKFHILRLKYILAHKKLEKYVNRRSNVI